MLLSSSGVTVEPSDALAPTDAFGPRHLPPAGDVAAMLAEVGQPSLEALSAVVVPAAIRRSRPLDLPTAVGEQAMLSELRALAARNQVFTSHLGMGYVGTIVPPVIQRNILENPGWYTPYTPYQAEISQGRLEALLNYQTMIAELTGLEIANASMLDEGTAAAEAVTMAHGIKGSETRGRVRVDENLHPQTQAVVRTRAEAWGWEVEVGSPASWAVGEQDFAVLLAYPASTGEVTDWAGFTAAAQSAGALVIAVCDPLALVLLRPPGEWGADIAVGCSQRFGVPMGYGGPHAGFLSTREAYKRNLPGRLIGVSRDARGRPALRLSLQTREQHIRRDKATSNICTAQALLAAMASMYAIYHGPDGLRRIAARVRALTHGLREGLQALGLATGTAPVFDTLRVELGEIAAEAVHAAARADRRNLRPLGDGAVGITLDETHGLADVMALLRIFAAASGRPVPEEAAIRAVAEATPEYPAWAARTSPPLRAEVFQRYHTEHALLRYMRHLEGRDLSLCHSMIPLGSCTMKLNATAEMFAVSWPEFANLHPFAPRDQATGYAEMIRQLEAWLAEITGFAAVSLQPNAGSQGEYAGLLAIRAYHESRGEAGREVCLIPVSAHGTNPASAVMAGFRVVPVACDARGDIDFSDLTAKLAAHGPQVAALMVTYPSTHGVFEEGIQAVTAAVHAAGGQVYLDGANLNAQVGLTDPATIGADVCHLNLHKTFCIPHGGGGPGVGPIGVAAHLVPHLPSHPVVAPFANGVAPAGAVGAVAAAPWGSALILTISWAFIRMMGPDGLKQSAQVAILNANYLARRLAKRFPVLFQGKGGWVAHEFILDFRPWKAKAGIEVEDVAKRLMDYGFHAPTMSWPVPGTLMVEPTESEDKSELDRFAESLEAIADEVEKVASGQWSRQDNPLKHAPHPAAAVLADDWAHGYGREQAAYPLPWVRERKFWPAVARVDNVYGDRNLVCSCVGMDAYR